MRAARWLAERGVTHVASSPLVRALATAWVIAQAVGDVPIDVWPDLREGFSHRHRGHGRQELLRRFPGSLLPDDIGDDGWDHGGDTYDAFLARCRGVVARLHQQFAAEDRVVLVTHGGCANYLLHAILQVPTDSPQWFDLENGAISTVRFVPLHERTSWPLYPPFAVEVLGLNDVSHLVDIRSR